MHEADPAAEAPTAGDRALAAMTWLCDRAPRNADGSLADTAGAEAVLKRILSGEGEEAGRDARP